jgi:hypothetical protein
MSGFHFPSPGAPLPRRETDCLPFAPEVQDFPVMSAMRITGQSRARTATPRNRFKCIE